MEKALIFPASSNAHRGEMRAFTGSHNHRIVCIVCTAIQLYIILFCKIQDLWMHIGHRSDSMVPEFKKPASAGRRALLCSLCPKMSSPEDPLDPLRDVLVIDADFFCLYSQ